MRIRWIRYFDGGSTTTIFNFSFAIRINSTLIKIYGSGFSYNSSTGVVGPFESLAIQSSATTPTYSIGIIY